MSTDSQTGAAPDTEGRCGALGLSAMVATAVGVVVVQSTMITMLNGACPGQRARFWFVGNLRFKILNSQLQVVPRHGEGLLGLNSLLSLCFDFGFQDCDLVA